MENPEFGEPLIMICEGGFYPIQSLKGQDLKKQAKDHGELNAHIMRVEDIQGNILWTRVQ